MKNVWFAITAIVAIAAIVFIVAMTISHIQVGQEETSTFTSAQQVPVYDGDGNLIGYAVGNPKKKEYSKHYTPAYSY